MTGVWVEYERQARVVPLRNHRLFLSAVCVRWHLDPTTLSVGDLDLTLDAHGNSMYTWEEIRELCGGAEQSVGTKQSPVLISGKPAPTIHPAPIATIQPAPTATITEEGVRTVLRNFVGTLRKSDRAGYPEEAAFLGDYPACKVRLPRGPRDGYPRLLWHALDKPYNSSSFIMAATKQAQPTLTVLFNVSGSGKTRTLYEIAVAERALFFVGVPESGMGAEGSGDLREVACKLRRLFPEGLISPLDASPCLKALLVSRFCLLRHMERHEGYVSNAAWLFMQVGSLLEEFYTHPDPLMALTVELLDMIRAPGDLRVAGAVFQGILDELKGDWNGPIMFDECQVIDGWLSNRFLSLSGKNRSFLDILVPCLLDAKFSRFFYAGTCGSMLGVAKNISGTLKSRATVMLFHGFGGFCTAEDLKSFVEPLLTTVDSMDFPRLAKLYKGRYRFFVTGIEHFIRSMRPADEATSFLADFFEKFCTTESLRSAVSASGSSSSALYMDMTVLGDVRQFLRRDRNAAAIKELKVILYHQVFGSFGTLVNIKDPRLQLVEYGLVWLSDHTQQLELMNIDDFFSGRLEQWMRLEEPAVLRALYHHFMTDSSWCRDMLIVKGQGDHSRIGIEFEKQAALGAAQELDGKVPAEFVRRFLHDDNKVLLRGDDAFEVPGVYFKPVTLVRPRSFEDMQARVCVERHAHDDSCYSLEKYVTAVEGQGDMFPTILLTGNAGWVGFRPDAIWFVSCDYEGRRRLIPCVAQMKSKASSATQGGINDAIDSTDLLSLEGKTEDPGLKKLIELASKNGLLRLAVLPHGGAEVDQECFNTYKGGLPRPSPQKRQKKDGAVQPLCGVIGGGGGSMFLKEWLVDIVWKLKNGVGM